MQRSFNFGDRAVLILRKRFPRFRDCMILVALIRRMGVTTPGIIANDPVLCICQIRDVLKIEWAGEFSAKESIECPLL